MFEAATNVEVVEVAGSEPLDIATWFERQIAEHSERPSEAAAWRRGLDAYRNNEAPHFHFSRITYRVIERLKGAGPLTFQLDGSMVSPEPRATATPRLNAERHWWGSDVTEIAEESYFFSSSCSGYLNAASGQRYLIFRGADGKLLQGGVRFRWLPEGVRVRRVQSDDRAPFARNGLNYEPVNERDIWLSAVRRASRRSAR